MSGTSRKKGKYLYYRCATRSTIDTARTCSQPLFRADQVDAAVWEWVKSFLTNPDTLAEGLRAEQEEREEVNQPLRDRLSVVDNLLDDNRRQLGRALDLYLSGDFSREILTERKERLQKTIQALERERVELAAQLEAQTLTDEQIETIVEFAQSITRGLEKADTDFEARRHIIELLDAQVTLAVEDGEKVVYVRCMLGEDVLPIAFNSTSARFRQTLIG